MILIKNLVKYIDDKLILKDINLEIKRGETFLIIGESGSGKTTLLKNIVGLEKPTKGEIIIFDKDITKLKEGDIDKIRKRMGMVFQEGALFDSLSVFENVAFPLRWHTRYKEDKIKNIVEEKLKIMGMNGTENLLPSQLSGGMRRRIGLARALVLEPEIVLYDEPTTGLDPIMTKIICRYILKLKNELNVTQIIVTHDMETAFFLGDRFAMICDGNLITTGTKEEIKNSKDKMVLQFIRGE